MVDKKPARKGILRRQRDQLLELFNHRCAICGEDKPQIHHIDENPSNNDDLNLLPLCPTCHIRDMHDPTRRPDREKLALFRKYRDPSILAPEFEPIFRRIRFILVPEEITRVQQAHEYVVDLAAFLNQFEKGRYYHVKVTDPIRIEPMPAMGRDATMTRDEQRRGILDREAIVLQQYRSLIRTHRDTVLSYVVEMLRFQPWARRAPGK